MSAEGAKFRLEIINATLEIGNSRVGVTCEVDALNYRAVMYSRAMISWLQWRTKSRHVGQLCI